MASSTPRSRRPGARLWLGLLLAAGWSSLEAAPDAGGAAVAPEPPAPVPPQDPASLERLALAALRLRRAATAAPVAGIVHPLPPPASAPAPTPVPDPGPSLEDLLAELAAVPAAPAADMGAIEPAAGDEAPPPDAAGASAAAPAAAPAAARPIPSASAPEAKSVLPALRELRRDPLEPPVGEAAAWHELLLSVTLNGRVVSQGTLFAERAGADADASLAVELASLRLWRVEADEALAVTFAGEPYFPLAALQGASWELDRAGLAVAITIPPERFAPTRLGGEREAVPPPAAGTGGFLDYDFLALAGEGLRKRLDGLLELGAFATSTGALTTSLRLDDVASAGIGVTRLDTTFTRDLPDRRATLRLGDSLTGGGALAAPVRFGGFQYATNFGTDPGFVPFPLPVIGGLAEQESVVDVLVDNLARVRGEVPSGPFAVDELPVVTGAGEVQLRVTDLLGRERLVTQPYYVSSRLLKPGLRDFSYELGFERGRYGEGSLDYGDPLAVATERYGITDRLTGEAHAEVEPDLQNLALGGSWLLGRAGVLSAGLGASLSDGSEAGGMAELGYEYDGGGLNLGARSRLETGGFAQVGNDDPARTDQLTLGVDLGRAGRLGLLLLNRDAHDEEDVTTVSASYGLQLGPGSLALRAAQFVRPDAETAVTLSYSVPLGPARSASAELERRDGDTRARAQFRQTRGASDLGLDYRLGADVGGDVASADARATYQARIGAAEVEVERVDDAERARAGVNGSVTLLDGHVGLSRQIGRAFGLVSLPGFPDVRVYLDNREAGRTDGDGRLLLPSLRPYEPNKVRLEVEDLPLDAALAGPETVAVPYDRSGVGVAFDLRRSGAATATLRDAAGRALPAGMRLASADGAVLVQVARDGFAQVEGASPGVPVVVEGVAPGGGRHACELPAAAAGEVLPDLGPVTCR